MCIDAHKHLPSHLARPTGLPSRSAGVVQVPIAIPVHDPNGGASQRSEDAIKTDSFGRSRVCFRVPPWVSSTSHVTTSLSL